MRSLKEYMLFANNEEVLLAVYSSSDDALYIPGTVTIRPPRIPQKPRPNTIPGEFVCLLLPIKPDDRKFINKTERSY